MIMRHLKEIDDVMHSWGIMRSEEALWSAEYQHNVPEDHCELIVFIIVTSAWCHGVSCLPSLLGWVAVSAIG